MLEKKFLGWSSLGLFVIAVFILLLIAAQLIFFSTTLLFAFANAQVLFMISGVLALVAAVLGFFSRQTPQGKAGGIGGLVLVIAIAVLLSFTLVTRVETQAGAVQLQSMVYAIQPRS
jgi:hypothetical protein